MSRVGIPQYLETFLQGRDQALGTYLICTDWKLFVKLMLTTLLEHKYKNESNNKSTDLARSVIRTPPTNQQARKNRRSNLSAPLTEEEKIRNKRAAVTDLTKVLNFLFMPAYGCLHVRAEWYLSSGTTTYNEEICACREKKCGDKCFICNGEYSKFMLPIVHHEAKDFLSSSLFGDNYRNNKLTFENMEEVPNILWGSPDSMKKIFGKKVYQYNVFAFFFQLLATGILSIDYEGSDGVRFRLTRDDDGKLLYNKVSAWKGFEFRTSSKGNNSLTLAYLMSSSK